MMDEVQHILYSFDAYLETTRSPQRSYSKQLSLLTFSLRSIRNCSKFCVRSIHKHILCRTVQLPDHPPRIWNPRLEKNGSNTLPAQFNSISAFHDKLGLEGNASIACLPVVDNRHWWRSRCGVAVSLPAPSPVFIVVCLGWMERLVKTRNRFMSNPILRCFCVDIRIVVLLCPNRRIILRRDQCDRWMICAAAAAAAAVMASSIDEIITWCGCIINRKRQQRAAAAEAEARAEMGAARHCQSQKHWSICSAATKAASQDGQQ